MTEAKTNQLAPSSVLAFKEALDGGKGALDAWLECNNEADVCAHVMALLAAERERCAAWLESEGRHDMAYGIRHAMHCGPNVL